MFNFLILMVVRPSKHALAMVCPVDACVFLCPFLSPVDHLPPPGPSETALSCIWREAREVGPGLPTTVPPGSWREARGVGVGLPMTVPPGSWREARGVGPGLPTTVLPWSWLLACCMVGLHLAGSSPVCPHFCCLCVASRRTGAQDRRKWEECQGVVRHPEVQMFLENAEPLCPELQETCSCAELRVATAAKESQLRMC